MSILKSAQLAEILASASPAGMLVVDSSGAILFANTQAVRWLGYSEAELQGMPVDQLVPTDVRRQHKSHRQRYLSAPKDRTMAKEQDLFAQRKDGTAFPVDISLHPFESEGKRYVLANLLDATQRRAAARLPEERLRAIAEMVSGLAHESRNALQRARASVDLLELDLHENPEQHELLLRIRRSLEDLEHNYDEVRHYAAPINLDVSEVELPKLVEEVVQDLESEFQNLPKIFVSSDTGVCQILIDRFRIKQVVRNCLENAIQATQTAKSSDPIYVNLSVVTLPEQSKYMRLDFVDAGEGLKDSVIEKMFEPFFTTKQKGTGLGLAICRRIIDAHKGTIYAESNPNGATVTVQLPITPSVHGQNFP